MRTNHAANEFESRARTRKALQLVDTLAKAGVTASEADGLYDQLAGIAGEAAGVRKPSRATWAVVVKLLEHREELAANASADPFDGLVGA